MKHRILVHGCALSLLALIALPAAAEDVKMKGATASVTGTAKVKVEDSDLPVCSSFASLDAVFSRRKFEGIDADGKVIEGSFKQKGTDGRKLEAQLTSKSKKRIVKAAKAIILECSGADRVTAEGSQFKFVAKVNKARDTLKVKGSARLEGAVDGERGTAKYTVKMQGPLFLATEGPTDF